MIIISPPGASEEYQMKPILLLLLVLAAMLPGACKSLPGADGRYATFDRGRSNNRADVPAPPGTAPILYEARSEARLVR